MTRPMAALAAFLGFAALSPAQILSDNPVTVVQNDGYGLIVRKNLSGFKNYGRDGNADIVYSGTTGSWTLDFSGITPVADLTGAEGIVLFALCLDDHTTPQNQYLHTITINGVTRASSENLFLRHGSPAGSIFDGWGFHSFYSGPYSSLNTATLSLDGVTPGFDWTAIDYIEYTISPLNPVPEPATLATIGIGVAAVLRRKKA